MRDNTLVESVLRRLLQESEEEREEREERGRKRMAQAEGLAAYAKKTASSIDIVLYDVRTLLDFVEKNPGFREKDPAFVNDIIRGVVSAARTKQPCRGAWMVTKSAVKNKGDGGLLYGLAFAGAGGPLTPDRRSVSPSAQAGWMKQASRGGQPFDDANDPETPDPSDDCEIHKDWYVCTCELHIPHAEPALNRTYEEEGWEDTILHKLWDAHDALFRTGETGRKVERALDLNSSPFFYKYYYTY